MAAPARTIWGGTAVASLLASVEILFAPGELFSSLEWLPLLYILVTGAIIFTRHGHDSPSVVETILVALLFIRLTLLPFLMHISGVEFYEGIATLTADEMRSGIRYMAYDTAVTGMAYIFVRHLMSRHSERPEPAVRIPRSANLSVIYILLVLIGLAALSLPQVRERFTFFASTIELTARQLQASYSPGYDSLANLANLARFAAPIIFITWAVRSYSGKKAKFGFFLALSLIVVTNLFYVSTSRASIFLPLLASILALRVLVPDARRVVTTLAGTALIAVTVVVTVRKSLSGDGATSAAWLADYVSIYLMGPQEYAVGLKAIDGYGDLVSSSTLISDIFGNVPILSALGDPINRTSQFFNWSYLGGNFGEGGGFILPAGVQGAFYLGPLLGPLVGCVGLVLAVGSESFLRRTRSPMPSTTYIAALGLIAGAIYYTNSISTMLALISFPILPLFLIDRLNVRHEQIKSPRPGPSRALR